MSLPADVIDAIDRGAGKRNVRFVVVHTEGDGVNNDTSAATIRRFHTMPKARYVVDLFAKKRVLVPGTGGRGWSDIGYNLWIRMNGLVELGRPFYHIPAGAKGFNKPALHIGLAGDGDLSDFTLAQYDSLFDLGWLLNSHARWRIPFEHFIGHREVVRFGAPDPRKTCPGTEVHMDRFRAMLKEPR